MIGFREDFSQQSLARRWLACAAVLGALPRPLGPHPSRLTNHEYLRTPHCTNISRIGCPRSLGGASAECIKDYNSGARKLTASNSSSSADDPPHDLVAAEGGGLVLDVEPQGDELILDAVIVLLGGLDDLASGDGGGGGGRVFDVARAKEH